MMRRFVFQSWFWLLLGSALLKPVTANTSLPSKAVLPAPEYHALETGALLIQQGKKQWQIDAVFPLQNNTNQYVSLTRFNQQPALYYAAFMDEVWLTFDQQQGNIIDCVYVSMVNNIGIPIRKARCDLNQPLSATSLENYPQWFKNTLSDELAFEDIAAQVQRQGAAEMIISQSAQFTISARYTQASLTQATPEILLGFSGQQYAINYQRLFVLYQAKGQQLAAQSLLLTEPEPSEPLTVISPEQAREQLLLPAPQR